MAFAGAALGLWLMVAVGGDARSQLEDVLRRGDYQRELPQAAEASPRPLRSNAGLRAALPRLPVASASGHLLFVLLALALVAALLAVVLHLVLREWAPRPGCVPASDTAKRRSSSGPPLTDFERLAEQGRYDQAIHALLLRALASLTPAPAPALTAREALRMAKLQGDAREALRVLVGEAERFWFAGAQALRVDFERCHGLWKRIMAARDREPA